MLDTPSTAISARWRSLARAYNAWHGLRLAVSGGPDSLAMLVGFARCRDGGLLDAPFEVVTIDHGLRAQSAGEAAMVAEVCAQLAVPCHRVRLYPPEGMKNKQAWARQARYGALAATGDLIDPLVLTAHTADDQAETFLMRAARGTGSEGLAGIRSPVTLAGSTVHRPFLDWSREDLWAVLEGSPFQPVLDPSNQDVASTRVRYRRWLDRAPAPDGARQIAQGLAHSAQLASLESEALDHYANALLREVGGARHGFVLGTVAFATVPVAVQARFLRAMLAPVARRFSDGFAGGLDLARMTLLAQQIGDQRAGRWVGGGAVLDWAPGSGAEEGQVGFSAFAEAGRQGFPVLQLCPGASGCWDQRFAVTNHSDMPLTVRAWQPGDAMPQAFPQSLSKVVLASLPVAVPSLGEEVERPEKLASFAYVQPPWLPECDQGAR